MQELIAAIDQGTTSSRMILFDRQGQIRALAQQEHRQVFPQPGWVEHDAAEIWHNTIAVADEALQAAGVDASAIAAIGITNQRETSVLWDRSTGEPLHNAIVWQDTRTASLVQGCIDQGIEDRVRRLTGLPLASYFSALKIQWLLDNIAGARERAEAGELAFGTMDSWVIWNLTGGKAGGRHLTDVTNASRTQLMSLESLSFDDELLKTFRIPRSVLPEILPSSDSFGEASVRPLRGIPITGVLGDQQAALVGQACFDSGDAKNTYGTGCFLLLNTGTRAVPSAAGSITTVAYQFGTEAPRYALEGSIAIAGALIQWLRDNLGIIESSSDIESLAREAENNGDVYFVPAFSGLYAPHWDPSARGIIAGLTRYANRSHIARAALEATALQTLEVVTAMEADAGLQLSELRCDGGMVANQLLMQLQAGLLDKPVLIPAVTETTALGAASAAGLATGFWKDTRELQSNWQLARRIEPDMAADERQRIWSGWQKAIARARGWTS